WDEVFDENITTANDKYLILRTVIDNWSDKTRSFKLQIKITDSNNKEKYLKESQPYILQPNEKKGMVIKSDEKLIDLLKTDKIVGQVIDCETNEVLATSKDRLNTSVYEIDENGNQKILNLGTKMYNVNVDYKIKSTDSPIPNTYTTSLRYSDGDTVPINKIIFNGYRFVESSNSDMKVQLNGKDEKVTLYYEPLQYKTINLKLFDEDKKTVIDQKQVKVFEHQTFTPKDTDFWVQNLQTNNDNEIGWGYKVVPESKDSYSYDGISNNSITINYFKIPDNSSIIIAKDVVGYKGEKMIFTNLDTTVFSNDYLLESQTVPTIISNNVDINTPGEYEIVYQNSETSTVTQKVTIKDKKMPDDWTPNYFEAEDMRLGSIFFVLKNRKISESEFNEINSSNLLARLKNPVVNNDKFKYDLDIISKEKNGMVNFSFNITHDGITKRSSNTWTLFFDINSDNNPNPPTPIYPDNPDDNKKNISEVLIDFVDGYKYYYTGKQITPEIVVTYKDNGFDINLINNLDYYIIYKNNTNVGTATLIIQGIGEYYNSKQITFSILKANNNSINDFKIENNKPIANSTFGKVKYRYCKNPNDIDCLYYEQPNETGVWYVQAYVDNTNNFNGAYSNWETINVENLSSFNNLNNNENTTSNNNETIIIVSVVLTILALITITGVVIIKLKNSKKKYKTLK
ncbi:MAG: hypothetical protein K2O21_03085, partial [Malacoplasma sp.]|nr:hypothetical protein [Malacoplasma sp.]